MFSWLKRIKRRSTWAWALATVVELSLEGIGTASVLGASLLLAYFPYSSDTPPSPEEIDTTRTFYTKVYDKQGGGPAPEKTSETPSREYEQFAQAAIEDFQVRETVEGFLQRFGLRGKKVLDVGSGSGYLQDAVEDYTGLDISPSARRFYHKPFAAGSATAMPFADSTFDALWTIWVLEHVPNPEQALREIRRVTKGGGLLFLAPAWDVPDWASSGYEYLPYRDFGLTGKLMKASIPAQRYFQRVSKTVVSPAREATWRLSGNPTSFRYRRLTPNYARYLGPDSDAVNSIDRSETALWFTSRGDECLNCKSIWSAPDDRLQELIIRVHKKT